MLPSTNSGPRRWKTAVGISLGLHAAAIAALSLLPARERPRPPAGPPAVLEGLVTLEQSLPFQAVLTPGAVEASEPPEPTPFSPPAAVSGPAAQPVAPAPPGVGKTDARAAGEPATTGNTARFPRPSFLPSHIGAGQRLVFLLDCSASMGPSGGLKRARRELLAALHHLPAAARFQVLLYDSRARPLLPASAAWLSPTPEVLAQAAEALDALSAEGRTAHAEGLRRALLLRPDLVLVLTDGADLTEVQLRALAGGTDGRTAIRVVEVGSIAGGDLKR